MLCQAVIDNKALMVKADFLEGLHEIAEGIKERGFSRNVKEDSEKLLSSPKMSAWVEVEGEKSV